MGDGLVAGAGVRAGHRPPDEPSYLNGSDHDLLVKLALPLGGGDLRLLAFDNRNEVRASSRPSEIGDTPLEPGEPNVYAWRGRSLGLVWNVRVAGESAINTRLQGATDPTEPAESAAA